MCKIIRTGLSKSKYVKHCQCSKALWLQVNKPEEAEIDGAIEARFAAGSELGERAKGLFGDYVDVSIMGRQRLDLSQMIEKTCHYMSEGVDVICEAAFCYEEKIDTGRIRSNYCAVDILRKTATGWAIYEVKSSTSHQGDEKNNLDKLHKYAPDIAYQKWVLENCGVNVTATYLITLNSDYVRQNEIDNFQLFNVLDLGELIKNEYDKLSQNTILAHNTLQQIDEPDHKIGMHCFTPYKCAFWDYCTRQQGLNLKEDKTTVFDLYRLSLKKKFEYLNNGIVSFDDLRRQKLNAIQQMQVECTLNRCDSINKEGIKDFLNTITYPLYFLDFESMQPVIPLYDGSRPYMQICFQYSLHYIEHEGGELKHTAFLAPSDGSDPRRALSEALCRDIPEDVCIMAYNDPFEKTRIKEMATIYTDLAPHLMSIHDHIIDLLVPFRQGHYYRPAIGGSFSIKKVLPALFPDDPDLDYHNLDEQVQNGGDAMTIFPQIATMTPDKAESARNALLEYCKLDTLAMVKIWQKLIETVK